MARLWQLGFEVDVSNGTIPDMTLAVGTGTKSRDTTLFRSGAASMKCDSTGSNLSAGRALTQSLSASTTYYFRGYFCFTNLPGSTVAVLSFGDITANFGFSARVTSGGKLQFFNNATGTQIGSDSAATISADGATWYRMEIKAVMNGSTQMSDGELQLDGVSVATVSGLTLNSSSTHQAGWLAAPGASKVVNVEDVAMNDSTGSVNNSWPGSGKVVLLKPISDSAVGTSWTDSGAATTNLWQSIDNTPPTGIADTTSNAGHQIRNAGSNTASYDANMTSYTTAGVGASDTLNAIIPWISHASPVATGAKTGSVGVPSNPTIANINLSGGVSSDFWSGVAAGTYSTGWAWSKGTVTEAPTVTLGTSPVMRVTITGGTASRIAMACGMFIYVDYTPAAGGPTFVMIQGD